MSRYDLSNLMKEYAEKENVMVQPKKMLMSKLKSTKLNQRRNRAEKVPNFVVDYIVEEEEDLSTQFLQMQKNQIIDLQKHFEC